VEIISSNLDFKDLKSLLLIIWRLKQVF
jgi:hypothetical protein